MKPLVCVAILALVSCGANRSLIPAIAPLRVLPVGPPERQQQSDPAQQQGNAAGATKDNSGATADQTTKPAAKGPTLIGCLSGPDKNGKYMLHSMNHRTGVEILGPDDLKNDSGTKVKLTGNWLTPEKAPANATAPQGGKASTANGKPATPTEMLRFQATDVEVMAKTCSVPAEVTPESKNKKPKPTIYQAPPADDSK